jgi:hypothetical protein
MKKLTIADAAEHFGVSKEAIHNRIRRGSLECVVDNGVKYVAIASDKAHPVADNRYVLHIEQENDRLRERVGVLETETSRLRDQREQMLIEQSISIEQIYKERDAQLRNILNVVATKFLSHANVDSVMQEAMGTTSVIEQEIINADIVLEPKDNGEWISLKSFLKPTRYPESIKKNLKRRFKAAAEKKSERFKKRDGKILLNPSQYEYSDLLAGC